jgi:hypothetical protein
MKTEQASTIRIFVASPGDVQVERDAAFAVSAQLDNDYWKPKGVRVEGYGWDNTHYPKLVNKPPQVNIGEGLPDMAAYDICIFLLWSRLGTPLDEANFKALPDGRQPTGTEYEFHAANQAALGTRRHTTQRIPAAGGRARAPAARTARTLHCPMVPRGRPP